MPTTITLNAWAFDAFNLWESLPPGWASQEVGQEVVMSGPAIDMSPLLISVTLTDMDGDGTFRSFSGDEMTINGIPIRIDGVFTADSVTVDGKTYQIVTFYGSDLQPAVSLPLINGQYANAFPGALTGAMTNPSAQATDINTSDIVCFCRGTLIETQFGLRPIESLKTGDLVWTKDRGLQPIRWIGSTRLHPRQIAAQPQLRPIRIRQGALGDNLPSSDLLVSPQHRILLRSAATLRLFGCREILVAAQKLLGLDGVEVAEDLRDVEYFHILFDRHEIVMSNGAETESLYTGHEAMKSVGPKARAEMEALFPELLKPEHIPLPVRPFVIGAEAQKLTRQHAASKSPLFE